MPNWCFNVLRVTGDPDAVHRFREACRGPVADWDHTGSPPVQPVTFNALVPVPPDVLAAGFGRAGYDWCIAHWGTKWDIASHVDWDDPDAIPLTLRFDTAWEPPLPWFRAIAARFPTLSFELVWQEPGDDLGGVAYGAAGQVTVDAGDARHPVALAWFGDPWADDMTEDDPDAGSDAAPDAAAESDPRDPA